MINLIAVGELIKKAKSKGINFGGGDPYNRLRYYTKIGWLPHMIRKVGKKRSVEGHYPDWALERLQSITEWKEEGLSNLEIERRIGAENVRRGFGRVFSFMNSSEGKRNAFVYGSVALLFVILIAEFTTTGSRIRSNLQTSYNGTGQVSTGINAITASGNGIFPSGIKTVFVKAPTALTTSKIYITFTGNYSPATRYWVSNIVPYEGFYIELDSPVAQNTGFSWWVS